MVRYGKLFKFVHLFHALFILINIITGIMMLRGMDVVRFHIISGIFIFIIPIILILLTVKGKLLYFTFTRSVNNKIIRKGVKVTAVMLLSLVILSALTGLTLALGIKLFSTLHFILFIFIVTVLPLHILFAIKVFK